MEKKNLKKTGISYFAASLLLLAITFVNVRIAMAGDVSFKSMFASSYSGEGGEGGGESGEGSGESGESGEGNISREECQQLGGIFNQTPFCLDGGVISVLCTSYGYLTVWGEIIAGSNFVYGHFYNVTWEKWYCAGDNGGCCLDSEIGIKFVRIVDQAHEGM